MNAIILAAGTSSRFVPLSEEIPKGLLEVKGEILIERQIRQLREAGVFDITVITGYKADMFSYLREKYNVDILFNEDYNRYNNISSLIRVLDRLDDTFICCSDHYFRKNVFAESASDSYYAACYAIGKTGEYCLQCDLQDYITGVTIGGHDAWYMAGHVYLTKAFSSKFKVILRQEYEDEHVRLGYWEDVYVKYVKELSMQIRRCSDEDIFEFDTLDELREFDKSYLDNTRSAIVKDICKHLSCAERELHDFKKIKHDGDSLLFSFCLKNERYEYDGCQPLRIKKI